MASFKHAYGGFCAFVVRFHRGLRFHSDFSSTDAGTALERRLGAVCAVSHGGHLSVRRPGGAVARVLGRSMGYFLRPHGEKIRSGGRLLVGGVSFGAVLPSLVALLVVLPLKGHPVGGGWQPHVLITAFLVNGAWGIGTALILRTLLTKIAWARQATA